MITQAFFLLSATSNTVKRTLSTPYLKYIKGKIIVVKFVNPRIEPFACKTIKINPIQTRICNRYGFPINKTSRIHINTFISLMSFIEIPCPDL